MFAAFASESFAWQSAIVATLAAVCLLIAIGILTFGPSLVAWADALLDEDMESTPDPHRSNVTPIDPAVAAQLRTEWDALQATGRVLPLAETRKMNVEVRW